MLPAPTSARPTPHELLSAALQYAADGHRLFPLAPGRKVPLQGSGGSRDATTSEDVIRGWWKAEPLANIGLATGFRFDVIDVDVRGEINGMHSLRDAAYASGDDLRWLTSTLGTHFMGRATSTPSGGLHLYVARGLGRANSAGRLPGVDFKTIGGFVVAAGSWSAEREARYVDCSHWYELPVLPSWLNVLFSKRLGDQPVFSPPISNRLAGSKSTCCAFQKVAFRNARGRVTAASEGTRFTVFNAIAYDFARLVAGGHLTSAWWRTGLLSAAAAAVSPLPVTEVNSILDRAAGDALRDPRSCTSEICQRAARVTADGRQWMQR